MFTEVYKFTEAIFMRCDDLVKNFFVTLDFYQVIIEIVPKALSFIIHDEIQDFLIEFFLQSN